MSDVKRFCPTWEHISLQLLGVEGQVSLSLSQRKRYQHVGQHVGEMLAPFAQAFR